MNELFLQIINISLSASVLILAVILLRLILQKSPKWIHVLLWGIVALRLLCPFSIESPFSVIPQSISSGKFLSERIDDYIGEISIIHDDSIYYEAAVTAGREPISDGNGGYYVVTKYDQLGEPSTVANTIIPILTIVWVFGIISFLLYATISYGHLHKMVATAILKQDNIYQSENISTPFVFGIMRPKIYLPYHLDETNMEYVIAHEQAHIYRKDHWWKLLGFLLLTIYWFHPLVWVAYILLSSDIELACDEKVIASLNNEQRADYSHALLSCSIKPRVITTCPLAFSEIGVKERISSILNYRKASHWTIGLSILVCTLIGICFLTNPISTNANLTNEKAGVYLTIGADNVTTIGVSTPYSSGGCQNADGTPFKKGELIYLEQLNDLDDLCGVTITASDKNGTVLFSVSIPDGTEDNTFSHFEEGDWILTNIK